MIPRYTRKHMAEVWSESNKFKKFLDVELALLECFEEDGLVEKGLSKKIREKVKIDPARIEEIENTVKHDIIAFLLHIEEQIEHPQARFLHFGLTSSDVLDTCFALQLKEAGEIILNGLIDVCEIIDSFTFEFRDTPTIGRTHGVHAEPVTLGFKFASWLAEGCRNYLRTKRAIEEISYGKISGAVGIYGEHLSPELERRVLKKLGLKQETVSTQIIPRDRHAFYFTNLALIAGFIERVSTEIRHLQKTEVLEMLEPFTEGQRGSSAMPHKKNPVLCENLCGLARLVRSNSIAALENIPLWHERDISHSSVERVIAPDSTILIDFMLHRLKEILKGLKVNTGNLLKNLNLTGGLIYSERILLALVKKGLKRGEAYELVQRNALKAWEGENFKGLILNDEKIREYLTDEEIEECFELKNHFKHIHDIIDRVHSLYLSLKEEVRSCKV